MFGAIVISVIVGGCSSEQRSCPDSKPGARMLALSRETPNTSGTLSLFDVGPAPCRADLIALVPSATSVGGAAWADRGGVLATVDRDHVRVFDAHLGAHQIAETAGSARTIAFDPTGRWLVWIDGNVRAWSTDPGAAPIDAGASLSDFDITPSMFEPGSDRLVVHGPGVVRVVDLAATGGPTSHDWTPWINALASTQWSPAGRWLVATSEGNGSMLIDTTDPSAATTAIGGAFAWSPSGARLAIDKDGGTSILDVSGGAVVVGRAFPGAVQAQWLDASRFVALMGTSLMVGDADSGATRTLVDGVHEWGAVAPNVVAYTSAPDLWRWVLVDTGASGDIGACDAPSFSPDGRYAVCFGENITLVADTTLGTRRELPTPPHRTLYNIAVQWRADSSRAWIDVEGADLVLDPAAPTVTPPPDADAVTSPFGWEPLPTP